MNKAKDVLISVLPSSSQVVRRAAAEGLSFLATFGVHEDAHFLQSAVIHSLDEVMRGNHPSQGQGGRPMPLEADSGARAGAVLALAGIQRSSYRIKKERAARFRVRGSPAQKGDSSDDLLPLIQMMTRVLPSIAVRPTGGFFAVRTFGLHAFGLLFAYSMKLANTSLDARDLHLLKKGVELVEDNFLASWNAASFDFDHGNEVRFLAYSFLHICLCYQSHKRFRNYRAGGKAFF
jgi:hypothetical protein